MLLLASLLAATQAPSTLSEPRPKPPHIVIIVADDLGWRDVGYHGSTIRTPHIDRLAREGAELDRFYVTPFCSPTRAGLMTGRYPIRYGMMRSAIPPWGEHGLDPAEATLPEVLTDAGYEHRGLLGKWHLGHASLDYHPLRHGFTEFVGFFNDFVDYFKHTRCGEIDWHRGEEPNDDKGYTSDLITDAAVEFIERNAGGEAPFFCWVAYNAPHTPLQAKPADMATYTDRRGKDARALAAMISNMDAGIGRILATLDDTGIANDTLVWFLSDNGGYKNEYNAPLRGRKGTVSEGGIRVPAAVRWPGHIPAGTKVTAPVAYLDLLPTLMQIVGIEDHGGGELDGRPVLDLLTGETTELERDLYFFIGQIRSGRTLELMALVEPEWKLVFRGPSLARAKLAPTRWAFLHAVDGAPNERTNLTRREPEIVQRMLAKLEKFRELEVEKPYPLYAENQPAQPYRPPPRWRFEAK